MFSRAILWLVGLLVIVGSAGGCGGRGDERRVTNLLAKIESTLDPDRKEAARGEIVEMGRRAVPALLTWFHDGDERRWVTVSWVVEGLPQEAQVDVIQHLKSVLLQEDATETLRQRAGLTVVNLRPAGTEAVLEALVRADAVGRRMAAWALTRLKDASDREVSVIAAALKDEDVGVRQDAAQALMNMKARAAPAAAELATALTDPDSDVRLWAVNALSTIGPAAIPHLVQQIGKANERTLANIFRSLGETATRALASELETSTDRDHTLQVLGVLQHMGRDASVAIPAIRLLEQREGPDVRRYARAALDAIQGDR